MSKKGFTLIELLIVVAIIGILAGIAIPAFMGQQARAARTEAYTNLQALRVLAEQYYAENGCYYKTAGACANTATPTTVDTVDEIRAFLPGFKPGDASSLNFTYSFWTTGASPAASHFRATATGQVSKVANESYWINSNNDKNF